MKSLLKYSFILAAIIFWAPIMAQMSSGRMSPPDTLNTTINTVDLSVYYSRPSVRERSIWGDLVPYNAIWRAGANEATVIEVKSDIQFPEGTLKAGKYALFIIPQKEGSWTAIFNSDWDQWGAFKHDSKLDALRIKIKPQASDFKEDLEFLAMGNFLVLHWEKLQILIPITPN